MKYKCNKCGTEFTPGKFDAFCPKCGSSDCTVIYTYKQYQTPVAEAQK